MHNPAYAHAMRQLPQGNSGPKEEKREKMQFCLPELFTRNQFIHSLSTSVTLWSAAHRKQIFFWNRIKIEMNVGDMFYSILCRDTI